MEGNQDYQWPIFLGGIPAEANEEDVLRSITTAHNFSGKWNLTLKGKRGRNGHLGFGFVYCEVEEDQLSFLNGQVEIEINGKLLESKKA